MVDNSDDLENNKNDNTDNSESENSNSFEAKSNINDNANDEKFLNKKTVEYVPTAIVYTITLSFVGIGAVLGFMIGDFSVGGLLCMLEITSKVTSDPTAISGDGDILQSMKSDMISCTTSSILTPLPLLSGLAGSMFGGYPAYKAAKMISGGKHLRSII